MIKWLHFGANLDKPSTCDRLGIGFAELLHADKVPASSPKHRQFLARIGSSGHHLLRLINDVLDLSKVESRKFV